MKSNNIIFFKEIDSTQSEMWRRIETNNIETGTVIMADIQTAGIGTHGRIWHTDEAKNIAFSLYIETNCIPEKLEGITTEIAEILVDIFKKRYAISLQIKYPNDIVYMGKKIGGILTESKVNAEKIKFLVIGIGINTRKLNFTDDIKNIATSIKKEFGIDVEENEIVMEFCEKLKKTISRRIRK